MPFNFVVGFALLLVCTCGQAAAQSFNLRIDPPQSVGNSGTAWSIEPTTNGRFVAFAAANYLDSTTQLFSSSVVTSILVDQSGEVVTIQRVDYPEHATYPGWSNSTARRADGGYCVGGNTFRTDSLENWISRAAIFLFSSEGAYEMTYTPSPDDQEWIGRQAKQTPDGGFVICGETTVDEVQDDAFVIKTDALGSVEWTQTYGSPNTDLCVAIDLSINGGYFLGGQYSTTFTNQDLWVQFLNDTGGVVWDRKWGSAFNEPNAHLTTAADGNILVASSWAYGPNWTIKRYLAKLDAADGSTIWEREYGPPPMNNSAVFYVVQEVTPGGDLIAGGPHQEGSNYFGALLRTTSEGDSLWMRFYQYHDSLVSNGRGLFRDVAPTPDGGFIACGTALPVTHADTLLYTQDVWVVKTDSMGCLEPGCHLITGVESQITNLKDVLRVWPNPMARGGAVQVSVELPASFLVQGQLRLTITDALGRFVQEQVVAQGTTTLNFVNTQRTTGLHHLHLSDNTRWISGAKLVVE